MPASDAFFRNIKKMHVVFAASAIALMFVTFWMVAADHSEEWHDHQRTFEKIQRLQLLNKSKGIQTDKFKESIEILEGKVLAAQEKMDGQKSDYNAAKNVLSQATLKFSLLEIKLKTQKAVLGVARANYDLGVRDEKSPEILAGLKASYDSEETKVEELVLQLEQADEARKSADKDVNEFTAALDLAKKNLKDRREQIDQIHKNLVKLQGGGWLSSTKRKVMEWPIIDGFNSHLGIKQDWLPDLPIHLGMSSTQRFDRCRTCHLGIDKVEAGNIPSYPHGVAQTNTVEGWVAENKFPHPYSTHPNPDLYMTASSPHPVSTFGCTTCHDGNGSGTKFQNAEHGPNNTHQSKEWKKKYGYHPNHFWEYPMQPKRFIESSCIKCHHKMEELGSHPKYKASAPKVFGGYQTIQKFGCFGCHEVHGFEGDKSIGPDLRLEPAYTAAAEQLLYDPLVRRYQADKKTASDSKISLGTLISLAKEIIRHPEESEKERANLTSLLKADTAARDTAITAIINEVSKLKEVKKVRDDKIVKATQELESQFLSTESQSLVDLFKNADHPGTYRKVGPSLRHIAQKTTRNFIRHWTEEPKRFRPTTRMPQFFKLTNQRDAHSADLTPVELAAVAHYLQKKSQPLDLLKPKDTFKPDVKRGKTAFAQKGCVACHVRKDVAGSSNDFGPDLSRISEKIIRDSDNSNFSRWLYTWIRDPQRLHPRSKMPNLFLGETTTTKMVGGKKVSTDHDPAADITAFLLAGKTTFIEETKEDVNEKHLNELLELNLKKVLTNSQRGNWKDANSKMGFFGTRQYPVKNLKQIKGDEIELALATRDGRPDDAQWKNARLNYLGRKTISRYGCYACHDIPGFEKARPIGTTLQDWGRKDKSKLAPEHIHEYLAHHGEPDGSSTLKRAEAALKQSAADDFPDKASRDSAEAVTFFYQDLLNHGRAGFLWQKLREPRSYDHEKLEAKGYDERLRMPKFPLNEKQIEGVATFVLGLVAEPPPPKYQYQPKGPALDRIEGERLLKKYNCVSCHMLELPEVTYWAAHKKAPFYIGGNAAKLKAQRENKILGDDLLSRMMPPRSIKITPKNLRTGQSSGDDGGEPVEQSRITFRGLKVFDPNEDPEDPEDPYRHIFNLWENLEVDGLKVRPGPTLVGVPFGDLEKMTSGRGGTYAEWLFRYLKKKERMVGPKEANFARHKVPPVLWQEGRKVQTPWLYQFLREPEKIRQMTVLRMPKFNISEQEARTLANYFAAVDGVPYPYQQVPQRNPEYIKRKNDEFGYPMAGQAHSDYLSQSWKLLNNKKLCIKCHSVGGAQAQQELGAKGAVQGPNLQFATDRLRPEWTLLWLSDPRWITPYTQMPVNFDIKKRNYEESFDGHGPPQIKAVRDALMNYHRLMEKHKKTDFQYPSTETTTDLFPRSLQVSKKPD
jgi:mono/diheme cytochrome c family protein